MRGAGDAPAAPLAYELAKPFANPTPSAGSAASPMLTSGSAEGGEGVESEREAIVEASETAPPGGLERAQRSVESARAWLKCARVVTDWFGANFNQLRGDRRVGAVVQ